MKLPKNTKSKKPLKPTNRTSRLANGQILRLDPPVAESERTEREKRVAVEPSQERLQTLRDSARHSLTPRQAECALEIAAFVGRMLAARRRGWTPDSA